MASDKRIEASTTVTSDKCIYTWTIKNYSLIKFKVGEILESPKFGVGSDDKKYFNLQLFPGGETEENAEYISLYLKPVINSTKKPDKLVCKWTLSSINDKKVVHKNMWHNDFATHDFEGLGCPKYHELSKIDQLISSKNTVTFQCELEVLNKIQTSLNSDIICRKDETIDSIFTIKFNFFFLSKELSDVKLIVEEKEIPAHKFVLAAVSPVFRDMMENTENSVNITDITKDILTEMLRYIYTGEIAAIKTDEIIELLAVSDKYQIDSLKFKCGKILSANLSSENAVDILIAAHKYKVKHLEDEVIKFVAVHTELLSNSKKIKERDDHDIWVNLTQSIVKSKKKVL
ncbi:speckle-type POZ protein-like [Trichogramma pretiosum]|uniref:speckle-type POZ protein-like n=1 Tax=Trichogramma pretiosum TaxID=7493 RepID=UPI0006C969CF|nr:speckle-type POZ protein-like [Trichogramma pretiosum]